jgi:hypothetical protein
MTTSKKGFRASKPSYWAFVTNNSSVSNGGIEAYLSADPTPSKKGIVQLRSGPIFQGTINPNHD